MMYRKLHPGSMQKAVNDIMEACSNARAYAILNDTETELVIHPFERRIQVAVAGRRSSDEDSTFSPSVAGEEWRMSAARPGRGSGGSENISLFRATLPDKITIEGLGINGEDWTEDEIGRVRFYPNGTSDEMSIVLLSDRQERRNIWLEVVTGLAEFEVDPQKFKAR
jgi:hypothetical protein